MSVPRPRPAEPSNVGAATERETQFTAEGGQPDRYGPALFDLTAF
jgi:hypothetical protein